MTAVERLAYSLRKAYADAWRETNIKYQANLIEANYPLRWLPEARELFYMLQAPQRELIEKWRRDADYLDEFADSKKRISAECRRELAAELERALEGKSDD